MARSFNSACSLLALAVACVVMSLACHRTDAQWQVFHHAVSNGDVATVRAMIEKNPNLVFAQDKTGGTALQYAAIYDRKDVAEILLANKAEVDARDDLGNTALHTAAARGHADIAKVLIAAKADVNAKTARGFTPLDGAAFRGYTDVAEVLLDSGAGVNAMDGRGATALYWAKKSGHKTMEDLLRQRGGMEFPPILRRVRVAVNRQRES